MDGVFSTLWWRATWALKESEAWLVFLQLPRKREWSRASSKRGRGCESISRSFMHTTMPNKEKNYYTTTGCMHQSEEEAKGQCLQSHPSRSIHYWGWRRYRIVGWTKKECYKGCRRERGCPWLEGGQSTEIVFHPFWKQNEKMDKQIDLLFYLST